MLLNTILTAINVHIEAIVDKKLTAALQNTRTLALMDDALEEKMKVIAQDVVSSHEDAEYHLSEDAVHDQITSYMHNEGYVKEERVTRWIEEKVSDAMSEGEFVTTEDVEDKLCGYVPEDELEEKIKEALENITLSVTIAPKEEF